MGKPKITKDSILFVGGMMGVAYQQIIDKTDRLYLLMIYGGMMGLSIFNSIDDVKGKVISKIRVGAGNDK